MQFHGIDFLCVSVRSSVCATVTISIASHLITRMIEVANDVCYAIRSRWRSFLVWSLACAARWEVIRCETVQRPMNGGTINRIVNWNECRIGDCTLHILIPRNLFFVSAVDRSVRPSVSWNQLTDGCQIGIQQCGQCHCARRTPHPIRNATLPHDKCPPMATSIVCYYFILSN